VVWCAAVRELTPHASHASMRACARACVRMRPMQAVNAHVPPLHARSSAPTASSRAAASSPPPPCPMVRAGSAAAARAPSTVCSSNVPACLPRAHTHAYTSATAAAHVQPSSSWPPWRRRTPPSPRCTPPSWAAARWS